MKTSSDETNQNSLSIALDIVKEEGLGGFYSGGEQYDKQERSQENEA